jgi:hypothetical protein
VKFRQIVSCLGCGQGWVLQVLVPRIDREIFVCEECETTWLKRKDIGIHQPVNFVGFMQTNGLEGLWTEITPVLEVE